MFNYKLSAVLVTTLALACGGPSEELAQMSDPAGDSVASGAQRDGSAVADVVYGHKDGMALTFDVLTPPTASNGAGVLEVQSGGWVSRWRSVEQSQASYEALLNKGFTVFVVRHGGSPKFNAAEAFADVQRAVRVIRQRAPTYGVDPERLGIHGGSAGGQLSLMIALGADPGDPGAEDEVLRESSRVAAVVAYYPPVDLRARTQPSTDFPPVTAETPFYATGLVMERSRWPALELDDEVAASISPILHVSSDDPPTLLVHGDADTTVDLNASQSLHSLLEAEGVETDLLVIEGAEHRFLNGDNSAIAMDALVAWFETHLVGETN
jgi:acetyl esterase/lipase